MRMLPFISSSQYVHGNGRLLLFVNSEDSLLVGRHQLKFAVRVGQLEKAKESPTNLQLHNQQATNTNSLKQRAMDCK